MYAKYFEMVSVDADVKSALGVNPTRLFPFGYAPQDIKSLGVYAVFQTVTGTPNNTLNCPPDSDLWIVQVDIYSDNLQEVRVAAKALIEASETNAYISRIGGESFDFETKRYRYSFDVSMIQKRS